MNAYFVGQAEASAFQFIPLIVLALATFTPMIIVQRGVSAFAAIGASFRAAGPRFLTVILLLLLSGILSWVGLIGCCIGIIITLPYVYAVRAVMYADVFLGASPPPA